MRAFAGVCSNMLIVVLFTALANKAFTQTVNIPNGINSVNATAGPAPVFFPDMGMLYERSWIPHGPVTDTSLFTMQVQPDMMLLTTAYKDLLGRPWQTVAKQASPGQKDMVQFFTYDKYGNPVGVFLSIEEWEEVSSELHLELPQWQKDALQVEMNAVKEGRAVLTDWDEVKRQFVD